MIGLMIVAIVAITIFFTLKPTDKQPSSEKEQIPSTLIEKQTSVKKKQKPSIPTDKHPSDEKKQVPTTKKWDFDSGDLRGLKIDNVYLKRSEKSKGFFLEFDSKHLGSLDIDYHVCFPCTISFSSYISKHLSHSRNYNQVVNLKIVNGGKHFLIKVYPLYNADDYIYYNLKVYENSDRVFEERWEKGHLTAWKINIYQTGQILIYLNGNLFFKYFFRNINNEIGTTIEFSKGENIHFHIDNLLLKGICSK